MTIFWFINPFWPLCEIIVMHLLLKESMNHVFLEVMDIASTIFKWLKFSFLFFFLRLFRHNTVRLEHAPSMDIWRLSESYSAEKSRLLVGKTNKQTTITTTKGVGRGETAIFFFFSDWPDAWSWKEWVDTWHWPNHFSGQRKRALICAYSSATVIMGLLLGIWSINSQSAACSQFGPSFLHV